MKNLLVICVLFSACSVFRHKTESSNSQMTRASHTEQHRDSLQLTAQAQRFRFLSADQLMLTEIIPAGRFTYKPDSGFTGEASSVRLFRQTQQRSLEKDTSAFKMAVRRDRAGMDSVLNMQENKQLKETKKSKPLSLWIYMLVALALLAIGFIWKRGTRSG